MTFGALRGGELLHLLLHHLLLHQGLVHILNPLGYKRKIMMIVKMKRIILPTLLRKNVFPLKRV